MRETEILVVISALVVKIIVWVVPVFLVIKYYLEEDILEYLNFNKEILNGVFYGVVVSFLIFVVNAVNQLTSGTFNFNTNISLDDIVNTVFAAAIIEEILFRGFFIKEIEKRLGFWESNIIVSILFLMIHYPIWIYFGISITIFGQIFVFMLSIALGFINKATGTIYSSIVLHLFYNLITIVFN